MVVVIGLALLISGCTIRQTVKPVEHFTANEICVIESPAVKAGFLEAYKRALSAKGYLVRQLPSWSSISDCNVTSTYSAIWRWDLAVYMAFAEIKVYGAGGGTPIGEARYDSHRGGANMGKFIDAEKKVAELVDQLFPDRTGSTAKVD